MTQWKIMKEVTGFHPKRTVKNNMEAIDKLMRLKLTEENFILFDMKNSFLNIKEEDGLKIVEELIETTSISDKKRRNIKLMIRVACKFFFSSLVRNNTWLTLKKI